jgi:AcrR family transcriptional regulator
MADLAPPLSSPAPLVPRQKRSRETLRRILDGFEAALREQTFEEVKVQDICTRAGCSIGTFYGRVESKEGLLDLLRDRVYGEVEAQLPRLFDPREAAQRPLAETLQRQCRALVELHMQRRGVIRALIVQARRRSEFAEYTRVFNEMMLRRVSETWMERADQINHDDPLAATEQAALMSAGYLRESVVFGDLWPARRRLTAAEHAQTLFRMTAAFLLGAAPDAGLLAEGDNE